MFNDLDAECTHVGFEIPDSPSTKADLRRTRKTDSFEPLRPGACDLSPTELARIKQLSERHFQAPASECPQCRGKVK